VQASLSEKDFLAIRDNIGDKRLTYAELMQVPVDIAIEGEPGFHLRGKIEYLAPAVDQQTGTILVRGIVHNPDRSLVPGLAVRMRLPRGKVLPNAVLVPDRAIQSDQGGRYVLVVSRQNVIEQRHVQLGEMVGALRIAVSGIKPDDRVVVADLWRATPGLKVNPKLVPIDQAESVAAGSQ
jgi:RND family efflux transporter MFP subunit